MKPQYLVQQPEKLEMLAISKLGDWIALQAEKLMSPMIELYQLDAIKAEEILSQKIELIRNCLDCNMPFMVHDMLFIETKRALSEILFFKKRHIDLRIRWKTIVNDNDKTWFESSIQRNVIGRMIETLFNKNLTCLPLDNDAMATFGASFYSKSYLLPRLTRLHLSHENFEATEANVIQSIERLHRLIDLSLHNCCTDNILICIAINCTLIEELTLSGCCINDNSIDILTHLPNLRSVDIYETEVSEKGIEKVLMTCKKIEHIKYFSDIIVCALEHIVSLEVFAEKRFKIKSFENDDDLLTLKQLQLIVQTCPEIQRIKLEKEEDETSQGILEALNELQDLRELELADYDFYADQIDKLLGVRGHNLVDLHFKRVDNIDLNALTCIHQMCPNLQCLTLINCSFVERIVVLNGLLSGKMKLPQILLRHLKRLTVHSVLWQTHHTVEQLLFLLSNCPNVEFVDIASLVSLDDIILKVLSKNPMTYLKELKLWRNKITNKVINRIIQNCIGFPEISTY